MGRIRTVKPEVARHEALYEAEKETGLPLRFAWVALFTACDREGRFKWRPRSLKAEVLPFDEIDFGDVLDAWLVRGFVVKYRCGVEWYGAIPTFLKHQQINNRETASAIPGPDEADEVIATVSITSTREARVDDASTSRDALVTDAPSGEGKGREWKGTEGKEGARPGDTSPTVLEFPTVGKGPRHYDVTEAQVSTWMSLFPSVDVMQELRSALAWVIANEGRRKTAGGMPRFLVNWLTRSNDSHRTGSAQAERFTRRNQTTLSAAARILQGPDR